MTLLDTIRAKIADAQAQREAAQAEMERSIAAAEAANRSDLTDAEQRRFTAAKGRVEAADDELRGLREREAGLVGQEQRRRAAERTPRPDVVRIGSEPRTYQGDPSGPGFFADVVAGTLRGDPRAQERLNRHAHECEVEARDIGTGAFTGLVPPQFLTDRYAELARASRPLANVVQQLPLPDQGMTLNISRITTGSGTAIQATENAAVQETDMDDTLLTVNVRTIAGMQDVSRQLFERGAGADEVIFRDLARAYATELDNQIINGDGTLGTHLGIRSTVGVIAVAYTDATPTLQELYPKLADAIQQMQVGIFGGPTHIVVHPRRWAAWCATIDSSGRPLVVPAQSGPYNAVGVPVSTGYGEVVGYMQSLPVLTDASIPVTLGAGTNEDVVLVVNANELWLWENNGGAPFELRCEQPLSNTLTVRLVAYGYSAFTAGRHPKASAVIGGTGLVSPTF